MKKRISFVSNSSSCSFVCCICGHSEGGRDDGYDDVGKGFVHDESNFEFCESHINVQTVLDYIKDNDELRSTIESVDNEDDYDNYETADNLSKYTEEEQTLYKKFMVYNGSDIPDEVSPVYNLEDIPTSLMFKFLMKKYKYKYTDEVSNTIRLNYKNLEELNKYLKDN